MIKINQLIGKSLYKSINTQLRIDLTSNNITNDRGIFKFSLKLFSQKDYKEKFQSFAKQNELNSEQIQKNRDEEDKKLKETLEDSKRRYEEESKKKKELFEKIKRNEPINDTNNTNKSWEIDLSLSTIKTKLSSVFTIINSVKLSKNKIVEDKEKEIKEETSESIKENFNNKKTEEPEKQTKQNVDEQIKEKTQEDLKDKKETNKKNDEVKIEKKDTIGRKLIYGIKDVWQKTFPKEENIEDRFERRREEARILNEKIKDASEEEIQKAEARIPEWKRGAIVLILEEINERENIFDKARKKLKKHMRNSELYQNYRESDAFKELEQIKLDYKEARKNLRDELSASQNPFVVVSRDLMDKVQFNNSTSYAVTLIRKIDPDFELYDFENEVDVIFKNFFEAFLRDDLDYLEKVSASSALGMMTAVIRARKELKATSKYKELLWIEKAQFINASLPEQENPVFRFRLRCQEINCLISKTDGKVVQGNEFQVESCQYHVDLCRNSNPEVEMIGHPWQIVGLERIGVVRQLI